MKITFKKNYNAKLDSSIYLAILPFHAQHTKNSEHDIFVATKAHHSAKILTAQPTTLLDLQDWQTILDVGISANEYRQTVIAHNPSVDLNDSFLEVIIFQKLPSKANEKIALFCVFYEKYCGLKYKITPREIGIIKDAEVTEELLKRFFESTEFWAKVKAVGYYVKNIQELKRMAVTTSTNGFPNYFDKTYLNKLEGPQISLYYAHLRSLGLVAKKNQLGQIIEWIPINQNHEFN